LINTSLLKNANLINGQWVTFEPQEQIAVYNPFDRSLIGYVPNISHDLIVETINYATTSFKKFSQTSPYHRSELLIKWANLIDENITELAKVITLETGKALKEAIAEIKYGNSFVRWFAEEAKRIYGDIIPSQDPSNKFMVIKQPIGVCAAITPWNFPVALMLRKCAAALAAGCTVIVKPSELTPFSSLALGIFAKEAGIMDGVINIITGNAEIIGQELCTNPLVKKISFTGSTPVGKKIMQASAATLKRLSFELGGNAPFIVFADADLMAAIEGLKVAKFRNSGQACIAANRIYVAAEIYDDFVRELLLMVKKLKMGNGLDSDTDIGPIILASNIEKIQTLVQDAIAGGANLLYGGSTHEDYPSVYMPTILTNIPSNAKITQEEIFGPVIALYKFSDEEEVINLANDSCYGLASYFYSLNTNKIWNVSARLESGMVGVNTGFISNESCPFGGIKGSGFGREGSKYGIDEYLQLKYICQKTS
jgi:succinate-semialdehyde dehydrogenase/glutarate-semialdehyde dehydrogenase